MLSQKVRFGMSLVVGGASYRAAAVQAGVTVGQIAGGLHRAGIKVGRIGRINPGWLKAGQDARRHKDGRFKPRGRSEPPDAATHATTHDAASA